MNTTEDDDTSQPPVPKRELSSTTTTASNGGPSAAIAAAASAAPDVVVGGGGEEEERGEETAATAGGEGEGGTIVRLPPSPPHDNTIINSYTSQKSPFIVRDASLLDAAEEQQKQDRHQIDEVSTQQEQQQQVGGTNSINDGSDASAESSNDESSKVATTAKNDNSGGDNSAATAVNNKEEAVVPPESAKMNNDVTTAREPDETTPPEQRQESQQPPAPTIAVIPPTTTTQQQQHAKPGKANRKKGQQRPHHHQQPHSEDDDVASKAAVALAAVAAAATANNKSPAEAAREARAVAQSLISGATDGGTNESPSSSSSSSSSTVSGSDHHHHPAGGGAQHPNAYQGNNNHSINNNTSNNSHGKKFVRKITLSAIKTHIRRSTVEKSTISSVMDKLCQGENDAFLQHLLLLEHFSCMDDGGGGTGTSAVPVSESAPPIVHQDGERDNKNEANDNMDAATGEKKSTSASDSVLAEEACEKLEAVLRKVEVAYDCLLNLLPPVDNRFDGGIDVVDLDVDGTYTPVIPDLLPPCVSPMGDATSAFFRACTGGEGNKGNPHMKALEAAMNGGADTSTTTTEKTDPPPSGNAAATNGGDAAAAEESAKAAAPPAAKQSMFSIFRRASNSSKQTPRRGQKVQRNTSVGDKAEETASNRSTSGDSASDTFSGSAGSSATKNGEYSVKIEREMLGLTVENVLERTVVRTVAAGGPAKKAGAKVGSLIVKVGNVETKNLTHFETIDELRQSNRPLQLVLRQISDDALRSAREEMGRLIRGSGFGTIMDAAVNGTGAVSGGGGGSVPDGSGGDNGGDGTAQHTGRPLIGADLRIDTYTQMLRRRFIEMSPSAKTKKDEALSRAGDKLVWILTLLVIGLERESSQLSSSTVDHSASQRRLALGLHHHTPKDYADAAKSVSRVLFDYSRKRLEPSTQKSRASGYIQHSLDAAGGGRRAGRKAPPPAIGAAGKVGGRGMKRQQIVPGVSMENESSVGHEKPLLQIGDVLHRTRTFLADTTSPPAALLRGETIAFLCDVLDIDTDMELSEEEAVSSTRGDAKAGAVNDLGSAGSLLKLIVLNCPVMVSPGCREASSRLLKMDAEFEAESKRRYGPNGDAISRDDPHRLHAGNRFLSVVHRLAASRSTSARITACSLGPVIWGHLDFPHQLQLRGVITRALHDVEVIVRKSTATVLHEIAELVFDPRCVPWLVLMCERAMTDPEPQLRSAAMTLTWHLADHLPNAFLGDASQGSRYLRRLPSRDNPIYADVYLLQCKLLPVATRLAEDRSPSVRLAVAAQCDRLCDALGDHWSSVIIDVLLALLSDSDERVRCEGVTCVPRLADIVLLSSSPGETTASEDSILEALVPASIKLRKDPSSSVRVALAEAAGNLLKILVALQNQSSELHLEASSERSSDSEGGKKYKRQVDERLIPLVQHLLNDNDPEVTSAALRAVTNATRNTAQISRAKPVSMSSEDDAASMSSAYSHTSREKPVFLPVLSEVQVLRLLPTLTELADSKQWRVRQSAVEIVPALLGCTQRLETRSEISKLCIRLMSDLVDAVRKTAAECLCMGGSSLGSHGEEASTEWITSIVIPTIRKCAIHAHSKQRLLSLKMVEVVLLNGGCPVKWSKGSEEDAERMTDSPVRELAAIALSLATDRIANVRLNVGRILESVIDVFEEEEVSFIKEVLTKQISMEKEREGGGDRDVLYFANKCVYRAKMILEDKTLTI